MEKGDVTVNIKDRLCEVEESGVIINGRTPGLDDLGIPLVAMIQYSLPENEEWRAAQR